MRTRQGYRPCSVCDRFASEWRELGGTKWAVTAPRGVTVEQGEAWTCRLCVEQGHEQRANQSNERQQTLV
jgi:hypothetical protein